MKKHYTEADRMADQQALVSKIRDEREARQDTYDPIIRDRSEPWPKQIYEGDWACPEPPDEHDAEPDYDHDDDYEADRAANAYERGLPNGWYDE